VAFFVLLEFAQRCFNKKIDWLHEKEEEMKKWKWFGFIGVIVLLGCPSFVFAGDKPAEGQPYSLEEVVVTASKMPRTPGNVTQKVDIVSGEKLDNIVSGNANMAELLTYEPGVFVSVLSRNDANWGSSGGLSQKYNTYMLDGLPIDAFVEPQSLPLAAFERIELQRGPASVLYPNYLSMDFAGNQSPLTGTTNVILKEHIDRQMSEVDLFYGSYNTFGGSFYHQQAVENLHFFFGGDYESSDYTNYGTNPSWLNMLDDPEYQKTKLFLKTTLFLNDRQDHKISLFFNRTAHEGDTGRPNRDFDHEYWTMNAAYALPIQDGLTANFKLGYRWYDRTWEEDNYPASLSLASKNGVKQSIVPADLSFSFEHLQGALMTIGSDYQSVSYETYSETSRKEIGNDANAIQYGLYLQEELPVQDFLFRIGGRYSYTKHDIDLLSGSAPGNPEQSWDEFLWSLGVRYHLNEMVSLYSNVGTSFVAPSLKSVGGTIKLSDIRVAGKNGQLPNPDLKAESGTGYDLGIDVKPAQNLKLGVRGFCNVVDDQIIQVVVSNNPSQSQDINSGKTTTYGLELSLDHKPLDWLGWFANYTYTHSEIDNDKDPDQDGAEVPFVPEHMGNIGVNLSLPMDTELSIYMHLAGKIYDGTSKSGRQEFDAYEVLNAKLRKTLVKRQAYRLDAYLELYNLTNNDFKMPWQFQDPGFSATGGIKAVF
jgi:iron complex outermembrane recepter protein